MENDNQGAVAQKVVRKFSTIVENMFKDWLGCSKCGYPADEQDRFCRNCGARFDTERR